MTDTQRIISDNASLFRDYQELGPGDVVIGRVRLKPTQEQLLVDLLERGVRMIPSALSQLASRSKTLQARLFGSAMLPHTRTVHDRHDLVATINHYNRNTIGQVVSKQDRSNGGQGIHLWNSIEEINNQAAFGGLPFPFVVQPFYPECRDVRVIILKDYLEAYERHNPHNFRNNLHCGGESRPYELHPDQEKLCRQIMARGHFPYAYIDLMVSQEKHSFLAEINLRGGMRGARLSQGEYEARVETIHRELLKNEGRQGTGR